MNPKPIRTVRDLLASLERAERLNQLAEICRLSTLVHRVYRRHGPLTDHNHHQIADALDRALYLEPTTLDVEGVDELLRRLGEQLGESLKRNQEDEGPEER